MNDILGLNQLSEKGVLVNVKVNLDSKTLLQMFLVGVALIFTGVVVGWLFRTLSK